MESYSKDFLDFLTKYKRNQLNSVELVTVDEKVEHKIKLNYSFSTFKTFICELVYNAINNMNKTERIYLIDGPTKIYVTGSHLVFDKSKNKFIKVENYSNATLVDVNIDWFSCLITSDHRITIGDELFWDWEDHFIKTFFA